MNRTEDKLFDNHFHKVLASKNNGAINAEVEEIEIKSDEANKIFRNAKIAVKLDEDFKPEIEKPLLVKRDALDYYPQSKMYQVRKNVYKVVLESTLWYMLYMTRGEYNKDLKNVYKEVKEGSIKAAGMDANEMVGKIRKNLQNLFPDRGRSVSFNSKRGRIDITLYSGKQGLGDLRDSFNKVQILIFPFDEMGRSVGSQVKTQTVFDSFTKEFGAPNKKLKRMPKLQTSHEKTIREINRWFSENAEELKQGDTGLPKSKTKSTKVKAAEVTAQSLGEMLRKELNPIFGGRNFFVRVDVRTEKHVPLGREGDIMVTYASLPKGTKEIVDNSLSITMISVRPFNEDGTLKEHGKVRAEAFRGTFFDANHKIRKDIKKMRSVKGDPVKVAQSIIKWFKKNKDILLEERQR